MTVFGGTRKSARELPSRRNSGLTARPSSPARRPDSCSRIGASTLSAVPGRDVERRTTVCRAGWSRRPRPTVAATRSRASVERLPFSRDGVPTQMTESSVSLRHVHHLPWPGAAPGTLEATSSASPGSTTGVSPDRASPLCGDSCRPRRCRGRGSRTLRQKRSRRSQVRRQRSSSRVVLWAQGAPRATTARL